MARAVGEGVEDHRIILARVHGLLRPCPEFLKGGIRRVLLVEVADKRLQRRTAQLVPAWNLVAKLAAAPHDVALVTFEPIAPRLLLLRGILRNRLDRFIRGGLKQKSTATTAARRDRLISVFLRLRGPNALLGTPADYRATQSSVAVRTLMARAFVR